VAYLVGGIAFVSSFKKFEKVLSENDMIIFSSQFHWADMSEQ